MTDQEASSPESQSARDGREVSPDARAPRESSVPAWVRSEYERIGQERSRAGRDADRQYRWELIRVCGEVIGSSVLGLVVAAFAFHVADRDTGMIFLYGGMVITMVGIVLSVATAYKRGQDRGDW